MRATSPATAPAPRRPSGTSLGQHKLGSPGRGRLPPEPHEALRLAAGQLAPRLPPVAWTAFSGLVVGAFSLVVLVGFAVSGSAAGRGQSAPDPWRAFPGSVTDTSTFV